MKLKLLLISLVVATACSGQEPDTLFYFDEAVHNSIVAEMQSKIDSIQAEFFLYKSSTEEIVIRDTFNLEIADDRIKIEIHKVNHNVWVDIIDGQKRINADYVDYQSKIVLMDSTDTVGRLYIR